MTHFFPNQVGPSSFSAARNSFWNFPAGEVGVEVSCFPPDTGDIVVLELRNGDSDAILRLQMEADAYRRAGYHRLQLLMPYVPYGRQDRVTSNGTSFSLEIFARIINGLCFEQIYIVDPHSAVTVEQFQRATIIPQAVLLEQLMANDKLRLAFFKGRLEDTVIVAPDKGAIERANRAGAVLGVSVVAHAEKVRTPDTGEITGMELSFIDPEATSLQNKHVIIVDDICDGGRTFVTLAELLEKAASRTLFVTHGIFSQGRDVLTNTIDIIDPSNRRARMIPGYDVFTTDAFDRNNLAIVKDTIPAERILTIDLKDFLVE